MYKLKVFRPVLNPLRAARQKPSPGPAGIRACATDLADHDLRDHRFCPVVPGLAEHREYFAPDDPLRGDRPIQRCLLY